MALITLIDFNKLNMSIKLRLATDQDIEWVNRCYANVDFLPSNLAEDKVMIASVNGCDAGIGRLVPLDRDIWELGGIYTLPEFRKQGVAAMLVQGLLKEAANCTAYCIPFAELKTFYISFGFQEYTGSYQRLPKKLSHKLSFCQTQYAKPVSLLVLTPH